MTASIHARTSDPISSHMAASNHVANGKRNCHLAVVIETVIAYPGKTSAELSRLCGLERHEVARRTSDGERCGSLKKGDIRKCDLSGRSAVTWWPA